MPRALTDLGHCLLLTAASGLRQVTGDESIELRVTLPGRIVDLGRRLEPVHDPRDVAQPIRGALRRLHDRLNVFLAGYVAGTRIGARSG
jgi:hypothetical protein